MTENQGKEPTTKWFRPHVRDLNKQEAIAKEKSNGSIYGMFIALAASGMAAMYGAAHVAQGLATKMPKTPTTPTPSNTTARPNLAKIDTKGLKSAGRTIVHHADDLGEFYENYKTDDEKRSVTVAEKLRAEGRE